jgi:DNA-binding NarL/FixJ family response regulator
MPNESAVACIKAFSQKFPHCRIVASTGLGRDHPKVKEALAHGASEVLPKPFASVQTVLDTVSGLKKAS